MGEIGRRSVIRAGAWSIPVIAIAATAPLAAASTGVIEIEYAAPSQRIVITMLAFDPVYSGSFDTSMVWATTGNNTYSPISVTPNPATGIGRIQLVVEFTNTLLMGSTLHVSIPGYSPVSAAIA